MSTVINVPPTAGPLVGFHFEGFTAPGVLTSWQGPAYRVIWGQITVDDLFADMIVSSLPGARYAYPAPANGRPRPTGWRVRYTQATKAAIRRLRSTTRLTLPIDARARYL